MTNEDMIDPSEIQVPNENARKVVGFFKGEAEEKFIETEEMADLVAYAASLRETLKEITNDKGTGKYDKAIAEIKRRLDTDKMKPGDEKVIKDFGDNKVLLTPTNGKATIDWEAWARGLIGDKDVDALLDLKKKRLDSRFISYGKDSVRCEIL